MEMNPNKEMNQKNSSKTDAVPSTPIKAVQPKNFPEWIKELENGNLFVLTKDGNFEFTDVPYKQISAARERAPGKEDIALIKEAMTEPKMGELDIEMLHGTSVMRMLKALDFMYDVKSFL